MNTTKKYRFKWEKIETNTLRAKVIGGWLVNSFEEHGESMVFIPDQLHEWGILEES